MTFFLVLALPDSFSAEGHVGFLTPALMRWSEHLWLMDLSPTWTYWQRCAAAQQKKILHFLQDLLGQVFPSYSAVLARHPWPAILLTEHLRQQQLPGILTMEDAFTKGLMDKLTWQHWLHCAAGGAAYFSDYFKKVDMQKQCERLRLMLKRLDITHVGSLKSMTVAAMQRRFGHWMALLWRWTLMNPTEGIFSPLDDFPWQAYVQLPAVKVSRYLDTPLVQWDEAAEYLREDMTRLCQSKDWCSEQEGVLSLLWTLDLSTGNHLHVPISFRHPHYLGKEKHHETAILQAQYQFMAVAVQLSAAGDSLCEIVSWDISVTSRLSEIPQVSRLFAVLSPQESLQHDLMQLENSLPVPLESYDMVAAWDPEASFAPAGTPQFLPEGNSLLPWEEAAKERPAWIYETPQKILFSSSSQKIFLERVALPWWHAGAAPAYRDYYQQIDREGRCFWIFQDSGGDWYRHGVFG